MANDYTRAGIDEASIIWIGHHVQRASTLQRSPSMSIQYQPRFSALSNPRVSYTLVSSSFNAVVFCDTYVSDAAVGDTAADAADATDADGPLKQGVYLLRSKSQLNSYQWFYMTITLWKTPLHYLFLVEETCTRDESIESWQPSAIAQYQVSRDEIGVS